jgi:ATP-binding cassette, subfamily B, bacterial
MQKYEPHSWWRRKTASGILVLEHGQIIERGTYEELMLIGKRYAELFNLQAEAYR